MKMSVWQVTLIDPSQLGGAPIGEAEAVRRALTRMTTTGAIASWSVMVEMPGGGGRAPQTRFGWAVMRGDAGDPQLNGDLAFDLAIIDATTGEAILPQLGRDFGGPVPPVPVPVPVPSTNPSR